MLFSLSYHKVSILATGNLCSVTMYHLFSITSAFINIMNPIRTLKFDRHSGASLYEFSDNHDFGKESAINSMLNRIANKRHLDKLASTIINDYSFVVLKSSEKKLALSDQYISTASLNCKGKIANFSNRTIGFSNCLIMIPISAKYYIAYYHGNFSLSKPVIADTIYDLSAIDTLNINKVILRNSYNKCIAMHKEDLEEIEPFRSTICGTTGTIMQYDDGSFHSYTLKKEASRSLRHRRKLPFSAGRPSSLQALQDH